MGNTRYGGAARFFRFVARFRGCGLAFGLAFVLAPRCVARAGGCHPRGPDCGDPSGKGRVPRPCPYCPTGGVGLRLGVSESASCLMRKRPTIQVGPLTGLVQSKPSPPLNVPEGGTRRLFRASRLIAGRAPLAIVKSDAVSSVSCRLTLAVAVRPTPLSFATRHSQLTPCSSLFVIASRVRLIAMAVSDVVEVTTNRVSHVRWRKRCVARFRGIAGALRVACESAIAHPDHERCARPHEPQGWEESAGITLGDV
jgi:hypothetical protein